jgi:hypothetical protein
MTLISNWKQILLKAWSMQASAIVTVCSTIEVLSRGFDLNLGALGIVPPGTFAAIAGVAAAVGMVLRLLPQPSLHPPESPP